MSHVREDAELASDLVILLGRELRVARKRIEEFEREKGEASAIEVAPHADAERAIAAESALQEKVARLEAENQQLKELYVGRQHSKMEEQEVVVPGTQEADPEMLKRVELLERDLHRATTKYQKQREAKRALRDRCQELEKRVNELSQGNEHVPQGPADQVANQATRNDDSESQAVLDWACEGNGFETPRDGNDDSESQAVLDWACEDNGFETPRDGNGTGRNLGYGACKGFMEQFAPVGDRPLTMLLLPVCNQNMDLYKHLASNPSLSSYSHMFMYFPGCISWASAGHALAFAPTDSYDVHEKQWKPSSYFSPLYGQTRELFYTRGWGTFDVYYAGTYTCHSLRHLNPEGLKPPNHISREALSSVRLQSNSQHDRKEVLRAWRMRGIKTECLGLQCVGFNHVLYEALLQRKPLGKRGGDPKNMNWASKKRKTTHA